MAGNSDFPISPEIATSSEYRAARELSGIATWLLMTKPFLSLKRRSANQRPRANWLEVGIATCDIARL